MWKRKTTQQLEQPKIEAAEAELLRRAILQFNALFPYYTKLIEGNIEGLRQMVQWKAEFFNVMQLASNRYDLTNFLKQQTFTKEAQALAYRFLPKIEQRLIENNVSEYLPDVLMAMLIQYQPKGIMSTPANIEELKRQSARIIRAGCEVELLRVAPAFLSNRSSQEMDQDFFYVAWEAPGLLGRLSENRRKNIAQIASDIKKIKAATPDCTSASIEEKILSDAGKLNKVKLATERSAVTYSSAAIQARGILSSSFPLLIKLEWTTQALENFIASTQGIFSGVMQNRRHLVNALKEKSNELTLDEQKYILKKLLIEDKSIALEDCIPDAVMVILNEHDLCAFFRSERDMAVLANNCIQLIKIGYYIKKHVKISESSNDEQTNKACYKTYFLKILKDPNILKNAQIWTDKQRFISYLGLASSAEIAAAAAAEQSLVQVYNGISPYFPYASQSVGLTHALIALREVKKKNFSALEMASSRIYLISQLKKNNSISNIDTLIAKFFPLSKNNLNVDVTEYYPDLAITMILNYELGDILPKSKSLEDVATLCLQIIKTWQKVTQTLQDRGVDPKKHDQYFPLMMQLELRFEGALELLKKINSCTLHDALLILDECPRKSPDEIRDLLHALGRKSAKALILRQMGITNLGSRAQVENVYRIYKEYEGIIDVYRELAQQKASFSMQRLERSSNGRSYIVHYDESDDMIRLPHLAQELVVAAVKTAETLGKIKHVGLATDALIKLKNHLFKLYLYHKDENNLLSVLDFERDDFIDEMQRDFFAVEKHKSRFASHINEFYIPVLLLEHYMPKSAQANNFLHKITAFNSVKDKVFLLVQSIVDIKNDTVIKTERSRFFATTMVEYFNGIYPGTPNQIENFKRMCHVIKMISANAHLSIQEKDRLYLSLMNDMIQEQLMLTENASITDICVYYNTLLSDGQDVGLELISHMLIEKAAGLSHDNLDRYKKIDTLLSEYFKQVSDPAELLRNKSKLVAIYAEYTDEKEPKIKFLEHYIKKYLVNNKECEGFLQGFNAAHANVVAQLDKKNGVGFAKISNDQRKKILKAELYFPNILAHKKIQVTSKNIEGLVANIRQVFEFFDMDRHFIGDDGDGSKVDEQQNSIRELLILSHDSGRTVAQTLKQAFEVLNIKEVLNLEISSLKNLSKNEEKYQHVMSLLACFTEYAPLDFIKYTEKRDVHFHHRLLHAYKYTESLCDKHSSLIDRKKDLFNMSLLYPGLMQACQTMEEISDMLTFAQDTNFRYSQDGLKLQLYLMRLPNNPVSMPTLTIGLAPEESTSASSSSSFAAWMKPAKVSLLDDDDIPMADFSAPKRVALKQQALLYVAAFELIAESELQEADKERLRMKLAHYLQLSLTDDKKISLQAEDIVSVYTLCDKLQMRVNQVLVFEENRSLSNFIAENRTYTHEKLSGGRGNKNEWEREADEPTGSFSRVGFLLSPDNKNILPDIKASKGATTYVRARSGIINLIYKGNPTAEQQEMYEWHEASYGAFDTNTPFKFYLSVNPNCDIYTILTPHGSCETGVIVNANSIYNVSYMPAQSPIDDFNDLKGSTAFVYKISAAGYYIDHMVHQGPAFFIDYARISYFYNFFKKYPQYALTVGQNDSKADEKVIAALQKQIAVLRGADLCYQAFYPTRSKSSTNLQLLNQLKPYTQSSPDDLYCFDSYNGKPKHRAVFEGWLHILNEESVLFTPQYLKYYAQIFNVSINKKEDIAAALLHFSRLIVQSDLQKKIFSVIADFMQGKASVQVCLQHIIDAKESDLEGRYEPLFNACAKQLGQLNKNNSLAAEVAALLSNITDTSAIFNDPALQNYLTEIGEPQARINQKIDKLFQDYGLLEDVKAYFHIDDNKKSLTIEELLHLLHACYEAEKTMPTQETSTAHAKFNYITALNYPSLLLTLPSHYNNYTVISGAQKTLDKEFQSVLSHVSSARLPFVKTQLMYDLCTKPQYKLKLLSDIGINKPFSDMPHGMRSRPLRDELLAIHLEYNQGLATFFNDITTPEISYDLYLHIKSAVNATKKYVKAFTITDPNAIQDVFLMQLHSLSYYPKYKNSLAYLLGRERETSDLDIITIAKGDTFSHFIRRHQKFSSLWYASGLHESPIINAMPMHEKMELRHRIIELQRFYNDESCDDEVIVQFFKNMLSGYIANIDRYNDLFHVVSFMKKLGKDNAAIKSICTAVLAQATAKTPHPLLHIFKVIRQAGYLHPSEEEQLLKAVLDRYQKYGLGNEEALLYIANDENLYPLLLLLNQTDLINKHQNAIGASFAAQGSPMSAEQLRHLHQMHLNTLAPIDKTKKIPSASDKDIFMQMIAMAKINIDIQSVILVLNEFQPHAGLYLENNHDISSIQKVLEVGMDIRSYISTSPELTQAKQMLFFISLYDENYTLSTHTEKEISLRYNQLQKIKKYQVNLKVLVLGGFEKISEDLKIPFEVIATDEKLKCLIDIYCDDDLRPILLRYCKNLSGSMAGKLESHQPYFALGIAYEMLNSEADVSGEQRRHYFELLLCSTRFQACIEQKLAIDRVYNCYSQVNNSTRNKPGITGVDIYYLVYVLLTMPDLGPQALVDLDASGIKDNIVLGILLATQAQLKFPPSTSPLFETDKVTIAVLKMVYESGFDEQTKATIYSSIVQNQSVFAKEDDLYTICDKAKQKLAYEKAKQSEELSVVAAGFDNSTIKRPMQQASEQIESYMQGRRFDFLGTGELEQIKYARMQYAYLRHPITLDSIFAKTKSDLNQALFWNVFDRIIDADYVLCVSMKKIFTSPQNKNLKPIADRLFRIELAFPGMLDVLHELAASHIQVTLPDHLRAAYFSDMITLVESLIDLNDPLVLFKAQVHQADIELIVRQEARYSFYKTASTLFDLEKNAQNEEVRKILPTLLACYAKYSINVHLYMQRNKKYFAENFLQACHYIIQVSQAIDNVVKQFKLNDHLERLYFHYPMFTQIEPSEHYIKQLDYAFYKIKMDDKWMPYAAFCMQFAAPDTLDQVIAKMNEMYTKDDKIGKKLYHLASYLFILQNSQLPAADKQHLSAELLKKFMTNSDAFIEYKGTLQEVVYLAKQQYELSFSVDKSDKFNTSKDIIDFVLKQMSSMHANGNKQRNEANYTGLSFSAGIYVDNATRTDTSLTIPVCTLKVSDGYHKSTTGTAGNIDGVEHTHIEINAGILYINEKLPDGISDIGQPDPNQLSVQVSDNGHEFRVHVCAPPVLGMQVMAILTAYEGFIRNYIEKSPGMSYLSLGTFKAKNIQYFSPDGKVFHDKATWQASQLAAYNYNAIASDLTTVHQAYQGRENNGMLKFNYAARMFAQGLALYQLKAPVITDSLQSNTLLHSINLPQNHNQLPKPLENILNNLLSFDSFSQFQSGLLCGDHLRMIAEVLGVGFEVGMDNIATLLKGYNNGFAKSEFSDALYERLTHFMRGSINADLLFKSLKNMAELSCSKPQARDQLLLHMSKLQAEMDKFLTPVRLAKYCEILGMHAVSDDSIKQILSRCDAKTLNKPYQSVFLHALHEFSSMRMTTQQFESIYHDAKYKSRTAKINNVVLNQKVNISLPVERYNHLLSFLRIPAVSVPNLNALQEQLHQLFEPQGQMYQSILHYFTVSGELILPAADDFEARTMTRVLLAQFIGSRETDKYVGLKQHINNWLYLYDYAQQLSLYEGAEDITKLEHALKLPDIEYKQREALFMTFEADTRNSSANNATHFGSVSKMIVKK